MKKKKKKLSDYLFTLIIGVVLLAGVGLLLYPTIANWYNVTHASHAIADYDKAVASVSHEDYERMLTEAQAYNERLYSALDRWDLEDEVNTQYESILDVTGTGIMAYIEIPVINVSLPVYHGTEETTLAVAVGHMIGSSFPIGGTGAHTILSGHSALPSAKLFTDLSKVQIGDVFYIKALGEVLTYQVDQIEVVLPYEFELFALDPKQDYCTLVTCTPYGVNTHRLLVRGKRIATVEIAPDDNNASDSQEPVPVTVREDAKLVDMRPIAIAAGFVLAVCIICFILTRKRKKKKKKVIWEEVFP